MPIAIPIAIDGVSQSLLIHAFFWIDGKTHKKTAFTQFLQPKHTPAITSAVASDQMALNTNTAGPTKKRSAALYTWSIKTGAAAISANTDLIRDRQATEQRIHKRCSVPFGPAKSLISIDRPFGKFRSRNRSTENTIHIAISYQCV